MVEAAESFEASKSAEEALQRLAAAIPSGVALLRRGQLVWANARLLEMAGGVALDAMMGTEVTELLLDSGHGLPDARLRAVECTLRLEQGEERTLVWTPICPEVSPGTDAWAVEDASHVRRIEGELLEASRELHRLHREVTSLDEALREERLDREELLTVVSHELRTPLTVIGGYHRLLLSEQAGELTSDQRRFLEESSHSCRRLDGFIENLLTASRLRRGGEVLEVATGEVGPVVDDVLRSLEPLLRDRGLHVVQEVGPGRRARFDRTALEQVLTNLVSNAIRHAPRGGRLELSACLRSDAGRPLVEIAVADDGPGVPVAERQRIFEPYVRLDTGSRSSGLGLGLAICRRLVEAHGGEIGVDSSPEGGARFVFSLPQEEA